MGVDNDDGRSYVLLKLLMLIDDPQKNGGKDRARASYCYTLNRERAPTTAPSSELSHHCPPGPSSAPPPL